MALQLNSTIGLDTYSEAYAKIVSQSSDNNGDKTAISYHVSVWKSVAHRDANVEPIDRDRYEVSLSELTSADFTGLYLHLKEQVKYADGVDV